VLFIFAGASAEFALNKAVDWLYFTGKLPADPLGRLFSTVTYARSIVFNTREGAINAIDKITAIHSAVEANRQARIPAWAYRDVLYMLIHYSIASFELLERRLSEEEKEDVYQVFYRLGDRMGLADLPASYQLWKQSRIDHLQNDLVKSEYSIDLFKQYKKHLGSFRFNLLWNSQKLVCPSIVKDLLGMSRFSWVKLVVPLYRFSRILRLDGFIKSLILPNKYAAQIKEIDVKTMVTAT
jgi:hypothetical protein